jgi:hypothetical protein
MRPSAADYCKVLIILSRPDDIGDVAINLTHVVAVGAFASTFCTQANSIDFALPDDGYYTLETIWTAAAGSRIVCSSDAELCEVDAGQYLLVNHLLSQGDPAHRQEITIDDLARVSQFSDSLLSHSTGSFIHAASTKRLLA